MPPEEPRATLPSPIDSGRPPSTVAWPGCEPIVVEDLDSFADEIEQLRELAAPGTVHSYKVAQGVSRNEVDQIGVMVKDVGKCESVEEGIIVVTVGSQPQALAYNAVRKILENAIEEQGLEAQVFGVTRYTKEIGSKFLRPDAHFGVRGFNRWSQRRICGLFETAFSQSAEELRCKAAVLFDAFPEAAHILTFHIPSNDALYPHAAMPPSLPFRFDLYTRDGATPTLRIDVTWPDPDPAELARLALPLSFFCDFDTAVGGIPTLTSATYGDSYVQLDQRMLKALIHEAAIVALGTKRHPAAALFSRPPPTPPPAPLPVFPSPTDRAADDCESAASVKPPATHVETSGADGTGDGGRHASEDVVERIEHEASGDAHDEPARKKQRVA
ncbi:hypothetical protein JCM10207_005243 [Rhodosporidiobolus poonsookiae]